MLGGWHRQPGAKRSKDLAETHDGVLIQDPAWESAGMRLFPRYDGHDPLERPRGLVDEVVTRIVQAAAKGLRPPRVDV